MSSRRLQQESRVSFQRYDVSDCFEGMSENEFGPFECAEEIGHSRKSSPFNPGIVYCRSSVGIDPPLNSRHFKKLADRLPDNSELTRSMQVINTIFQRVVGHNNRCREGFSGEMKM